MTALIFSMVTLLVMAAGLFMVFSGNATTVLRKHYAYQVRTNAQNACMVYGDLLVRSGMLDNNPATPAPNHTTLDVGCLAQDGAGGRCKESSTCTIEVRSDNKIHVTVNK